MLNFCSFRHIPDICPRRILIDDPRAFTPGGSQLMTPDSTTIAIMPRQRKILDATNHDGCSCRRSHFIPNWQIIKQCNKINGGSIFLIAKGIRGREELRFNFQFQTQPLLHILCTYYVLIAYRRGVWLQRGFVVWTQTEDQERGEGRDQKTFNSKYLNFWESEE
jgi:hypothetical protein